VNAVRLVGIACFGALACSPTITDPPPVSTSPGTDGAVPWVDVFLGTTASGAPSPVPNGAGGSTNPAAALPFGMVQWGPDTPNANPPGYEYTDTEINGFSVTHISGAGCASMRDFPVFPVSGAWDPSEDATDTFSHDAEVASPGFYEVSLGSGIKVDLTATQRTGLARFTFPHDRPGTLLVGASRTHEGVLVSDAHLSLGPDGVILGQRKSALFCGKPTGYTLHFAARFDRPFADFGAYDVDGPTAGATDATGTGAGIYLDFDTSSDAVVQMKIGLSYVSDENALANLDAEDPGWDFDGVHGAAIAAWNAALGHVAVEGGSDDDRRELYTALYHTLLQPAVASDVNGQFMGFDDQVHTASGYVRYQNYSGWDVYRSWIQLVAAVAPDQASDIVRSLVEAGTECGAMPKWAIANREASTMVGDPADPIVASAYGFGARGFDAQAALGLMREAAENPSAACQGHPIRTGLADELSRHYLAIDAPNPPWGAASTTVEYAVDDFCIAQLAAALGDATTHTAYMDRAGWWKNVFDPARQGNGVTGYIQPRYEADSSGMPSFDENGDVGYYDPLDVLGTSGFVEGNATQYTFAIQHDVPGLVAAVGGDAALIARLDAFFTDVNAGLEKPNMYIGNEPNFATPWEYDFVGAPWETQAVVRRMLQQAFGTQPGGLPGNDDLGATSSWQVWAMLGMYPAIPGVGGVVLGSPTFPKATLTLAGGAQLVVLGDGAAPDAPYVQSLTVNGAPSTSTWIDWATVAGGGTIEFTLGASPNTAWGSGAGDRPPVPN
jgi:predicted alpha-1,2-mannosidase